jgi:hypothetical protein
VKNLKFIVTLLISIGTFTSSAQQFKPGFAMDEFSEVFPIFVLADFYRHTLSAIL